MTEPPARWTKATVYPDMWVDPDVDPRRMEGPSADGELATYQDYLRNYRLTLRLKCEGLDAEQLARRSVPPSTLSLLGLVRHLAECERDWRGWVTGERQERLYGSRDGDVDGAVADQAVVDAAFADLEREQQAADAVLLDHTDMAAVLPDGSTVRDLWVHHVEEYARHCGHADLLRECVDGRVGQ